MSDVPQERKKAMQNEKIKAKKKIEKLVDRPPTHCTYRLRCEPRVNSNDDSKREEKLGKPPAHPLIRTKEKTMTPEASP